MSEYVPIEEFNSLKTAYLDTVELLANALKRITQLEEALFLQNEEGEIITNTEDKPVISPKLTEAMESPIKQPDNIPTGKTEIRACKLVERLKQARDTAGNKFLSSCDIVQFLKHGIDEKFRVKEGQNVRQVKKEVLEKAAKMYPDIFISQKSTGRKDLRLVLKT